MASWTAIELPFSDFGGPSSGWEAATYSFHPEDRPAGQSPSFDYDAVELPYSRFVTAGEDYDGFELAFYQYVAPGLPAPSEDFGYWG